MTMLARDKQSEASRARRRMYPIHCYVGKNGSGKSLAAVYDTLPDLDAGLPCLSTVRLLDYVNPRPCEGCDELGHDLAAGGVHMAAHPGYVPFTRWDQLLTWRSGPVIMDEITGVASSGDRDLPAGVEDFIAQMRRADVSVRITGIAWIRVNKQLREVVSAVTRCRAMLPYTVYNEDGSARMWRPRKLAKWVTYDAQTLPTDDHTSSAYDKADQVCKGRHWIPTSPARTAYDTLDSVTRVGTVTDSGRCVSCGGHRRAPECSCPDYAASRSAGRSGRRRELAPEHAGRHTAGTPVSGHDHSHTLGTR